MPKYLFDPARMIYKTPQDERKYARKNRDVAGELNNGGPFIVVFSKPVYVDWLEEPDLHFAMVVTRKGTIPFPLLEAGTNLKFKAPAFLDEFTSWMLQNFGAQYIGHLQAKTKHQEDVREMTTAAVRYLRMNQQQAYETRLTIEAELYRLNQRYHESTPLGFALHRELLVARNLESAGSSFPRLIPAAVARLRVGSASLRRALEVLGIYTPECFQLHPIIFRQREWTVIRAKGYTREDDEGLFETMYALAQLLEGLYAVAYEDDGRWDIAQYMRWADAVLVYSNVRLFSKEAYIVPITEVDRLRDQDFASVKPRVFFLENRDTEAYPGSGWQKVNQTPRPGLDGWQLVKDHWSQPATNEWLTVYRHPII